MRSLVIALSYLFSGLQMLASVLIFPLTILCAIGLIGFTIKIARDMRLKRQEQGPPAEADRLLA
jgi:hypothetical protein